MKPAIMVCGIMLIALTVSAFAQFPSDPVAYYPFNGNANDESGNGHNGSVNGAILTTDRTGNPESNAYSFDGSNDFIDIGQLGEIDDVSLSIWFKSNSSNQTPKIFGSSTNIAPYDNHIFNLTLELNNSNSRLYYLLSTRTGPSNELYGYVDGIPNDQDWHHIALTRSGSSVQIFIDGEERSVIIVHGDNTQSVNTHKGYFLGADNADDSWFRFPLNGCLDDIRIYNRALISSEVQALYQESGGQSPSGLVAYYPFENDANDASGNGNNGVVYGASWGEGVVGEAIYYDGVNDYVLVNENTNLDGFNAFSISVWLKPSVNLNASIGRVDIIEKSEQYQQHHSYGLTYDNGRLWFGVHDYDNWFDGGVVEYYADFSANQWFHIVARYDGISEVALYVNSNRVGSQTQSTLSGRIWDSNEPMWVGMRHDNMFYFPGALDEFRLYDRALSLSEIQMLYQEGEQPVPENYSAWAWGWDTQHDQLMNLIGHTREGKNEASVNVYTLYLNMFDPVGHHEACDWEPDIDKSRLYQISQYSGIKNRYRNFLRRAHSGTPMTVEALAGIYGWSRFDPGSPGSEINVDVNNFITDFSAYNSSVQSNERFDAIHVDVEPQSMGNCNQDLYRGLGELIVYFRERIDLYNLQYDDDVKLIVDISHDFENENRRPWYPTSSKTLCDSIIDLADEVVIMDYFTDPIVIVASALHELQYASQNGGAKKVRIGLETNCLCPDASTESFFNWNEETRLSDLSYAIDYIYEMCGNIPCFGGIALHSLPFFNPQDSDDENACSECIEQHPSLKIYKGCPVDFIITDPAGMQVGRGGGNIPGASYSVFEISETDSGAIITIPSPLPGIYLIGVIPWPSALPTDTYSITALWDNKPTILALDVPIAQIPDDGYIFSTLTSANISGTTSASGQGLAGVSIGLFNLQGELYASVATDGSGYYEFEEVPNGDYFIDCQPPLGFSLISEPMMPLCIVGLNQEINFELQEGASGRYLDLWTWKMCLNDLRNNGPLPDIFSVADANRWAGAIFEHYYSRGDGHAIQINDVTCTDNPSRALSFDDLVRVMVDVNGPSVGHQTQIKLLTNILNVASGRMSQRAIVSVDGATASQGIQYFSHLYQTENRDSLVVAYRCLQYMYSKRMIPAGVIPLTIPNIMYRLEMESEALPEEFSLSQSHPNPFNAQCIIDFALPSASHVRLEIFDILGRRVSSLIDEDKQAGYYQVAWDAKDRPSGMYFYRIEAGEFIETKKMMLLK